MINLFGYRVNVVFIAKQDEVFGYAWHYSREKAFQHLSKIMEYHGLDGEIKEDKGLEDWLQEKLDEVVVRGKAFELPEFNYRNRGVYEEIMKIPKGKTATYSEIARKSGVRYGELLSCLMKNPFQILIPCHRLVTKRRTLMGFYPLGVDLKRKLLCIEGADLNEENSC